MQVLKFGGSSVADAAIMSQVVDIVTKAVDRDRTILVISAIKGCTDTLIRPWFKSKLLVKFFFVVGCS